MCEASDALIRMTVCYFVIHFKDLENVGYEHPGLPIFQAQGYARPNRKQSQQGVTSKTCFLLPGKPTGDSFGISMIENACDAEIKIELLKNKQYSSSLPNYKRDEVL